MQAVFKAVRTCVAGKIEEVARKEAAKEFGKALEQMCGLTDALDVGTVRGTSRDFFTRFL